MKWIVREFKFKCEMRIGAGLSETINPEIGEANCLQANHHNPYRKISTSGFYRLLSGSACV